jgi:regulator of sigma E protease
VWYILVGILVVSVIVLVHETGHFVFAKMFGLPVEVFCLGYGKPFIKREWRGTVYGIGPFPFGGYVKIPGLDPREKDLLPEDQQEGFVVHPYWKRTLMVVGGPVANTVMAILIYVIIFMIGVPGVTTTIDSVVKDSPAAKAGVKAGDVVTAVDKRTVKKWDDFVNYVRGTSVKTVRLTVRRSGHSVVLTSAIGVRDGVRYIGVQARPTPYNVGMGFIPAVKGAVSWTANLVYQIFHSLWLLLLGKLPFRPLSPVGIVEVTSQAAQHGFIIFMNFVAFISVAIGATNLIPIYPLDGARAVIWTVEAVIRRQLANWAVLTFQYAGVGLLLVVSAWAVYLDIFKAIPDPFK